jgi:methyltransferase
VALHGTWLAGLWLASVGKPLSLLLLAIFIALQALRLWVLTTLKERWTTRIIVLPGAPLIPYGPYRFMRHPNYAIVAAEIFVLPMVFGLYAYAIAFTLLNGVVLAIRIRAENQALQSAPSSFP